MSVSVITSQIEADAFDEYVETGGMLSRKEFQESLGAIRSSRYLSERNPSRLQARSCLKRLSLGCSLNSSELTTALEHLYVVLRTKNTPPCSTQSDQTVFLQALLMLRCYEAVRLFKDGKTLPYA